MESLWMIENLCWQTAEHMASNYFKINLYPICDMHRSSLLRLHQKYSVFFKLMSRSGLFHVVTYIYFHFLYILMFPGLVDNCVVIAKVLYVAYTNAFSINQRSWKYLLISPCNKFALLNKLTDDPRRGPSLHARTRRILTKDLCCLCTVIDPNRWNMPCLC